MHLHPNATRLGPRKYEVLRAAMDGEWFSAEYGGRDNRHCVKLFERGYLRRDCPDIHRFAITDEGRAVLAEHDRKAV